ncbi:response regulator [Exilibacterium tricleocarpae]|uniref:Response regulator n=1 Tax=Exilibacterium tricleocarpae TaxID=2591008 RepID=A0A545TSF2_9GAMM|nr:response regulator [Exilibacterium tricleocarpae]TQV80154.1 response regulator [Exilibacterium tricleocarpae]
MKSIEILLIEDNPGDVELTREALSSGKVFNTLQVIMDGEAALDYLFQRGKYSGSRLPDIILLDLNLPKVSGREILRALKEDDKRKTIPIIILSSSEAAFDIRDSYRLHANCFVSKPVQLKDFMRVVQTIRSFWIDIVQLSTSPGTADD